MKVYFLVISFLLITLSASAQVYYVTFVKGYVKLASTGKILTIGDKINHNDQLIFQDKNSKISCISPVKGRFDISLTSAKQVKQKEWVTILKDALIPSSPKKQFSTRGEELKPNDPRKQFPNNRPDETVLLPENEWIPLNPNFELPSTATVLIQYIVNGKSIVKELTADGQKIRFSKDLFVNHNGEMIAAEKVGKVTLTYNDTFLKNTMSKVITRFRPILISVDDFRKQAFLIKTHLEALKKSEDVITAEIYEHFNSNYGYTNPAIFEKYKF
jgi:hypothetical protein